jgi:hypothetical protein
MVTRATIDELLNTRLNKILQVAEACLPEKQFRAYRGIVLDEFGRNELGRELERLDWDGGQEER